MTDGTVIMRLIIRGTSGPNSIDGLSIVGSGPIITSS
jgi:hypothetical protein